jgi:ligand-binding sensor domain-containing protein/signal transduction histidine kinase
MELAEDIRARKSRNLARRQANSFPAGVVSSVGTVLAAMVWVGDLWAGSPMAGFTATAPLSMSDEFTGFNFGKQHGLPDDDVRDILQTRDGSLWILTQQGLARFDGTGFTVFDRANSPEFQSDDPRVLAEDSQGDLWIGGKNLLLRMSGNSLQRVTIAGSDKIGQAYRICADPGGLVWIGGESTVARVTEKGVTIFGPESGLYTGGHVQALQVDHAGKLFAGTFNGLFCFDGQRQRFERADPQPHSEDEPIAALALHAVPRGDLWGMFDRLNNSRTFYLQQPWVQMRRDEAWVTPANGGATNFAIGYGLLFILEDRRGNVWLPAEQNQLHRLRGDQLESLKLAFPRSPDLATCLREDHEGSLWMGTLSSGLWRWQPRCIKSYSVADGLPHENVWALCEGAGGAIWVGTDGGLSRFADGHWESWKTEQGLSRNNIRALAVDREGTVWIGTGEGLNSWRDGAFTQVPMPGDWFEAKIRVILPTRDGALWVAGAAGLHRLAGGQRTRFTTAEGLANNDVRALLEDSAGRLWVGTFGGGLQCYEHGRFITYSTTNGLASGFVWALHQDIEGALWIGTEAGLCRLRDGRIATFGKAQGLPDNLVNFILEDDLGQLWISHDHGIYRVRRAALNEVAEGRTNAVRCVSYTKADGLPSEETNGQKSYPSACKARDGRLWFATTKGVAVMDPKLHHEEQTPPPVVIERFRVTGDLVFTRDPQEPLSFERRLTTNTLSGRAAKSSGASEGKTLQLPPGSGRVIEFAFTANTFVSADRARFKYRLLGLDEKWVDAGARRQALFTNLKPGNYRFQVLAANHHGVWNETGATCAFFIAPFFHETWWFYSLCGGLSVLAMVSLVAWRLRESRRLYRLERLAAVATERSRIAQDLHDGLGADLTRLSTLADLASGASDRASRDQLRKLAQSSREATRGLKDLIWMANPDNDTLESFLDRLCQNAEDYLRDAQIVCRFDLAPDLPPLSLSLDQRRNLLLVAREALNNLVKHSGAAEVSIAAWRRAGYLELAIQDNGRGFNPGDIRSGAMGLGGMRRRIESLGGHFQVESSPGAGTRVVVQIRWQATDHAKPQG